MRFSVIIATCGRPERLASALDAVARAVAASGEGHRVIVVDNGPGHPAEPVVRAFAERSGVACALERSEPCDKSRALNAGIRAAQTDWLAFTDDDTLPDPGWLVQGARCAEQSGWRVFGGRVLPGEPRAPLPVWMRPGRSGRVPAGGVFVRYEPRVATGLLGDSDPVPFGASLFAQRRLFAECGGYDEALWRVCGRHALGAEDAEFGLRLRRLGIPIGYCREALVVHPVHTDRLALGRQVALAYHYGWREPLLFFDPRRRLWERYRWRRAFAYAASAGRDLCLGDRAGAAAGLVEVARSAGGIVARWSPAYRRWAVLTRQRGV